MNLPKFLGSVETFLRPQETGRPAGGGTAVAPAPVTAAPYLDNDISDLIAERTDKEMQELPFGAFELDKGGMILRFNDCEAELTGRPPHEVVGRNFFTEIAPCTQRPEFLGRFLEGVRAGKLDALFQFTFVFKDGPVKVWCCLKTMPYTGTHWVFIKRL